MKERWLLPGMVSAGIAGCAALPEDVTKDGARFDFVSANTPYSAAICIARNARAMASTISGEERLLGDSSTEVVVRQTGGRSRTIGDGTDSSRWRAVESVGVSGALGAR